MMDWQGMYGNVSEELQSLTEKKISLANTCRFCFRSKADRGKYLNVEKIRSWDNWCNKSTISYLDVYLQMVLVRKVVARSSWPNQVTSRTKKDHFKLTVVRNFVEKSASFLNKEFSRNIYFARYICWCRKNHIEIVKWEMTHWLCIPVASNVSISV